MFLAFKACAIVPSSKKSNSPPTGNPCANLVILILNLLNITKKLDHDEFSYIDKSKINLFLNLCDYSINTNINSINFLSKSKYFNYLLNLINTLIPFLDIFDLVHHIILPKKIALARLC